MGNSTIAVSIIMPVYNSEKYLRSCVDSVLAQDFDSFELLLIDDGSTDGSPAICDEFGRLDSRVKVFHKENGGICAARNYGMERAQGEYIAFSDHDDIVLPGFLADNYTIAKENNADIVKFGRKALYIEGNTIRRSSIRQFACRILKEHDIRDNYLRLRFHDAMTCVWDGFYRRLFLEENRLQFDTRYKKGGEDIDFCGRCFAMAKVLAFNSPVYYEHFIRKGFSTSTKKDDKRLIKFQMLVDNLRDCCQELGLSVESSIYKMCVTKEQVYPTLSFLASIDADEAEMIKQMEAIHKNSFSGKSSVLEYLKEDKKWGVFTWLFEMRKYRILYQITKRRSF